MYLNKPELLEALSDPDNINVVKFLNSMLNHNTCVTAQSLGFKLADIIVERGRNEGFDESELAIHQAHCSNHLHDILMGTVEKYLGKKMVELYRHDLGLIPFQYRVACSLTELLIYVD